MCTLAAKFCHISYSSLPCTRGTVGASPLVWWLRRHSLPSVFAAQTKHIPFNSRRLKLRLRDNYGAHRVSRCVELSQEFAVNEALDVVDHEEHDGLGYEVPARLCHDLHIRVDQIPDRLHLTLQLWVDRTTGSTDTVAGATLLQTPDNRTITDGGRRAHMDTERGHLQLLGCFLYINNKGLL